MIIIDFLLVTCDESKNQPTALLAKRHTAMHDNKFRIHLDRDGLLITMALCLTGRWMVWLIMVNERQRGYIYSKICILQRAFCRRFCAGDWVWIWSFPRLRLRVSYW
jgi:hypothetical protein